MTTAAAPEMIADELVLYVATNGNDRWTGRLAQPTAAGDDGPFATPARARDAIRELYRGGAARNRVRVLIRGGTYFLAETLAFLPEDSGTADAPVIYTAFPGEAPILSGGQVLSDWKISQRADGKILWTIDLPEVAAGKWRFKQLFVDGVRRARTRLPREGFYRFASLPEGKMGLFDGAMTAVAEPGQVKNWKNLGDVEITTLNHWFEGHVWLDSVDETTNLIRFKHKALGDLNDENGLPARYWIENVFETMDQPGDWYLDRAAGKLYYLPTAKQYAESTRAIAPRLQFLVRFLGNAEGEKVRHIRFENLKFRHAEWTLPENNPGAVQASYFVPGAIQLRAAEDCVIFGCEVSQISQYAIEITRGCQRNKIVGCALFDLGAGGVKINPERPVSPGHTGSDPFAGMDINDLGWGSVEKPMLIDDTSLVSSRTTVSDCTIHDGGIIFPSAIGVWLSDAGRNRIHHNHIYNLFYSGVSCGWTWSYTPARAYDNRIEYNHIHDIGRGVLSDMGAIYTLGPQPGTVLRGNVIHDIRSYGYGGWGLYTDEGSSYITLENNVIYRTKSGGFHQHYGRDNIIRNNVFALGDEGQILGFRPFCVRPFVFEKNIVFHTQGITTQLDPHAVFDKNIYWRDGGAATSFGDGTFEQWQSIGRDRKGLVANPLLADPHGGNMSLRADSPALKLGIKPIDTSKAGPRFGAKRPASYDQWPQDDETPSTIVETRLEFGTSEDFARARAARDPLAQKATMLADAGQPQPICVIVRNWGDTEATGRIELRCTPARDASIEGPMSIEFTLAPGQRKAIDATVMLSKKAKDVIVEARPVAGDGMVSTAIALRQRPRAQIGRIDTPSDAAELFEKLAAHKPFALKIVGEPLAELRLAVAGDDHLAIVAKVTDRALRPNLREPWTATSVEIYAATPGKREIGQLYLIPAIDGQAAAALGHENWKLTPAAQVRLAARSTSDGYEIAALAPLSMLKIADPKKFLLDGTIGVTPGTETAVRRAPLFGGKDWDDNSGFATIEVK